MPFDITRSLLTVLVPGFVAIGPWVLFVLLKFPSLKQVYVTYEFAMNTALFVMIIVVGTLFEILGSTIESMWDKLESNKNYEVTKNWHEYLACILQAEPVGYRYMARKYTTLYFEINMIFASLIAMIGLLFLLYISEFRYSGLLASLVVVFLFALPVLYWWFAKCTHQLLCKTRQALNPLIKINLSRDSVSS